jgi:hypothetical protein
MHKQYDANGKRRIPGGRLMKLGNNKEPKRPPSRNASAKTSSSHTTTPFRIHTLTFHFDPDYFLRRSLSYGPPEGMLDFDNSFLKFFHCS